MLREALTSRRLRAMTPGEASAYFVSRSVDGLTSHEEALLVDWLAVDQVHVLEFERARRAWDSFDGADDSEILNAIRDHARRSGVDKGRGWIFILTAAAALVLVVTAGLLFVSPLHRFGKERAAAGEQVAWTQYAADIGQVRAFKLPDGSTMTLDTNSVADIRFIRGERWIRLAQGRAFFDVAKDVSRPFIVLAATRRVTALGTRFEVDTNEGGLQIALFRGRVAVDPAALEAAGQHVILNPGQRFTERAHEIVVAPIGSGDDDTPDWLAGLIDLDLTPLSEAVKQVNRYSRTRIVIPDPTVAAIRVSGQFRAGDAQRFAATIAEIYPVKVVRRNADIELVSDKNL